MTKSGAKCTNLVKTALFYSIVTIYIGLRPRIKCLYLVCTWRKKTTQMRDTYVKKRYPYMKVSSHINATPLTQFFQENRIIFKKPIFEQSHFGSLWKEGASSKYSQNSNVTCVAFEEYRISSYSFRGNYSFCNLEIQRLQYINVPKLFKGRSYSRAETIWGNTAVFS